MSDENYQMLLNKFQTAKAKHDLWHGLWQDCYNYALPQRGQLSGNYSPANRRGERLYDATALDAVDQLASLLLGNLTPPLTPWFGLKAGTELSAEEAQAITPALEKASRLMQAHLTNRILLSKFTNAFWIWWWRALLPSPLKKHCQVNYQRFNLPLFHSAK